MDEHVPLVWRLGQQDSRDKEGHPIQLEMEATQMPGLQHDLRDLRDPSGQSHDTGGDQPRRQARAVDVVEASLSAVIIAKQRLGGYDQEIKTLQDAINLWSNRHCLSGFEER